MELDFIKAILLIADVKDHFHNNKIVIFFERHLFVLKTSLLVFGPVDNIFSLERLAIKITPHLSSSTGNQLRNNLILSPKLRLNITKKLYETRQNFGVL